MQLLYASSIRNHHIDEICSNKNCCDTSCRFRHPRFCRYFCIYGRCKFENNCAYLHERIHQNDFTELKEELRRVNLEIQKVVKLQEKLTVLEKAVLIQNTEVDTMVDTHLSCAPEPATRVSELETNFYI